MAELITPELRARVGQTFPPLTATVTEDAVRRYCRAVGRRWTGRVPWLFLAHLGADQAPAPQRTDGLSGRANLFALPLPLQRTVVGGMGWDFGKRPRVGDILTLVGRYVSLEERQGQRSGPMLVSVLEVTFTEARGEWVATQRLTRISR